MGGGYGAPPPGGPPGMQGYPSDQGAAMGYPPRQQGEKLDFAETALEHQNVHYCAHIRHGVWDTVLLSAHPSASASARRW